MSKLDFVMTLKHEVDFVRQSLMSSFSVAEGPVTKGVCKDMGKESRLEINSVASVVQGLDKY